VAVHVRSGHKVVHAYKVDKRKTKSVYVIYDSQSFWNQGCLVTVHVRSGPKVVHAYKVDKRKTKSVYVI